MYTVPMKPEEDGSFPETGITEGYGCWCQNLALLQGQPLLLNP